MKAGLFNFLLFILFLFTIFIESYGGETLQPFQWSQWSFYKDIEIPRTERIDEPVLINLDKQILDKIKQDGSDIIILENGKEIPYKLILEEAEDYAPACKEIKVSSIRPKFRTVEFSPDNLIDGNYSKEDGAYFQIDSTLDSQHAFVIFDLGLNKLTDTVRIYTLFPSYTWEYLRIDGSNDSITWNIIQAKKFYKHENEREIIYSPSDYRFLKFSFWHTGSLVINEMQVFGPAGGKVIFRARAAGAGKKYKIYYGNPIAKFKKYDVSHLYIKRGMPEGRLSEEKVNPQLVIDLDRDKIIKDDNCALIYNPEQEDADKDGIGDVCDNCPDMPNETQEDVDKDGVGDACDNCKFKSNPDQLDDDFNGTGFVCDDADKDNIVNINDNCVYDYNPEQSDVDRNGVGDVCEDLDNDGISAVKDNCLHKYNPDQKDTDKDNIGDACDNCKLGYNPDQIDKNENSMGDACEDYDNDGILNYKDNCIKIPNFKQEDTDNDGVGNACDNCPDIINPEQEDSDKDKTGDICEDSDGDKIINVRDNCPYVVNPSQKDKNNNGVGDACEDWDNDGISNAEDNCIWVYNPEVERAGRFYQLDSDNDGIGDKCDKKDNRILENKKLIWVILLISIGIILFLAYRLSKKKI